MVHKLYPFSLATEKLNFQKSETMKAIEKPKNYQERGNFKNAWGLAGLVFPLPPQKNYIVLLSHGPALSTSNAPYVTYLR